MKSLVLILSIMLIFLNSSSFSNQCKPLKNPPKVSFHFEIYLDELYLTKSPVGTVKESSNGLIDGVLVEVIKPTKQGTKLICACQTNETGRFQFDNLTDGKYLIRFSKDGYNRVVVNMEISKSTKKSKHLTVTLEQGV